MSTCAGQLHPVKPGIQKAHQQSKMFNFFKRSAPPPVNPATRSPRQSAPPAAAALAHDPVSVPEVQEGNEHTDWALWEDSVMVLDSQLQGLTPSARIYERVKERPSEYQDIDPFSSIGRNSP